ncbi:hypothetical protein G3I77_00830 [Streptomyces sp. D2-8]|uniref:hypothetical protein n=1 Tax=Streptomyces sp. D2-8 TaxID=2707767 RepID=UPI0020BE444D|nr:hypothetical protein [Streptomyces sp. D2-8]MCK8431612.1 hypothetical protein [Streptomyces sp. D2-8]
MYAVKVVLLPSPEPVGSDGPDPPVGMPGDRRLGEIADRARIDPQPGIAHVSLARWGGRLVGMTFVEAADLDEAVLRARSGWDRWLNLPGLLPGWVLGDCMADRYLTAGHRAPPAPRGWHDGAMST